MCLEEKVCLPEPLLDGGLTGLSPEAKERQYFMEIGESVLCFQSKRASLPLFNMLFGETNHPSPHSALGGLFVVLRKQTSDHKVWAKPVFRSVLLNVP